MELLRKAISLNCRAQLGAILAGRGGENAEKGVENEFRSQLPGLDRHLNIIEYGRSKPRSGRSLISSSSYGTYINQELHMGHHAPASRDGSIREASGRGCASLRTG